MSTPGGTGFPIAEVDDLLSTTRTVRQRLDLDRAVANEVILDCIDLAEQAPTGGNQPSRRWLVVTDSDLKAQLGAIYRRAAGNWMIEQADRLRGSGHHNEKTMASAAHLAENLARVPALVIVTIHGEHDRSGRPGLFDSVIQSAWSFCLALRARGLGTAWTTSWLAEQKAVAELLGIPSGVTQIVMLPVAYTVGTDFRPVSRRPAREITWFDGWGFTNEIAADGDLRLDNGPGVTVEVDIDAAPDSVWPAVIDIGLPAEFSNEFDGAEWLDDPDDPGARWVFELDPIVGATRLRFSVRLGPGPTRLRDLIAANPDDEAVILRRRLLQHRDDMNRTVEGIRDHVESRRE